jgi:hypothetical protein
MTMGMGTRSVGSPIGTSAQYARQPGLNVVPLSVFFLNMQGEDGDDDSGLYGRRKRRKKRRQGNDGERDGKVAADRVVGGGADKERQSSASGPSESVTMATGTPLTGGVRATHATIGATGSGNVAGYPVPLGGMLRRTSPIGTARRKRKKRTEQDRGRWIERLLTQ